MRQFDRRTTSGAETEALGSLGALGAADDAALGAGLRAAVPAGPLKVQVQTHTRCNAACVMCPYPVVAGAAGFPHRTMSEALYDRLLDQLAGRPVERFSPFLMNEPLLDRRLATLVGRARVALPATTLGLFTNGAALTPARAEALAAAGLDELCVSLHGFDAATCESVMGLPYDRLLARLRAVVALHAAGALGPLHLQIVTGDAPEVTGRSPPPPDWLAPYVLRKAFSNERAVAGEAAPSPVSAGCAAPRATSLPRPLCQRPFVKLYVMADGECVMCNCDWRRRTALGSLARTPLTAIWQGDAYEALRRRHVRRDFPAGDPCAVCDYPWRVDE